MSKLPTGDRGQRFKVTYLDQDTKVRKPFGYTDDSGAAHKMCDAIRLHPLWYDPEIEDRGPILPINPEARGD